MHWSQNIYRFTVTICFNFYANLEDMQLSYKQKMPQSKAYNICIRGRMNFRMKSSQGLVLSHVSVKILIIQLFRRKRLMCMFHTVYSLYYKDNFVFVFLYILECVDTFLLVIALCY